MKSRLILLNKPFGVICQFTPGNAAGVGPDRPTLKSLVDVPEVYPAGRLDTDSEGLLLLTDDGALQARIAHPRFKLEKVYWAQVEGAPTDRDLAPARKGLDLGDFVTAPATARVIAEPSGLWLRDPPIRVRQSIPTSWVEVRLHEGKNRQVRRMTAKLGFPTLRLIRAAIGPWSLGDLLPGQWREGDPGLLQPPRQRT